MERSEAAYKQDRLVAADRQEGCCSAYHPLPPSPAQHIGPYNLPEVLAMTYSIWENYVISGDLEASHIGATVVYSADTMAGCGPQAIEN
eukprot:2627087-Amphidinium_carterae.1